LVAFIIVFKWGIFYIGWMDKDDTMVNRKSLFWKWWCIFVQLNWKEDDENYFNSS